MPAAIAKYTDPILRSISAKMNRKIRILIPCGGTGIFEDIPAVIVLLDEGSASASEILAAGLNENENDVVTLVGETSFGKGTIQDAKDFSDGAGLHVTVAKWLTPNKNWVHEKGIEPEVEVEMTVEDFEAEQDPQLDKALELANEI